MNAEIYVLQWSIKDNEIKSGQLQNEVISQHIKIQVETKLDDLIKYIHGDLREC